MHCNMHPSSSFLQLPWTLVPLQESSVEPLPCRSQSSSSSVALARRIHLDDSALQYASLFTPEMLKSVGFMFTWTSVVIKLLQQVMKVHDIMKRKLSVSTTLLALPVANMLLQGVFTDVLSLTVVSISIDCIHSKLLPRSVYFKLCVRLRSTVKLIHVFQKLIYVNSGLT